MYISQPFIKLPSSLKFTTFPPNTHKASARDIHSLNTGEMYQWILLCSVVIALVSGEHQLYLDTEENYQMSWSYTDSIIKFTVRVKTTGYVGLGLSGNGGMAGADIVVGWVKDGEALLYDMHGPARYNSVPLLDAHNDWILLAGAEEDGFTELSFGRNLITCDSEEDSDITMNTIHVIWSYSESDPDSIIYLHEVAHNTINRGSRSLLLLEPEQSDKEFTTPEDAFYHDIKMDNYPVPIDDTTYWCKTTRAPELVQSLQIIAFEPIVQPGNERIVHHLSLLRCVYENNIPDDFLGEDFVCAINTPFAETFGPANYTYQCKEFVNIWAVGGQKYYFDNDIGFQIGGTEEKMFYLMEMHYDNPGGRTNVIDSSGMRIWYIPARRPKPVSTLTVVVNHHTYFAIPPHSENFVTRMQCPKEYFESIMNNTGIDEITLLSYMHHTHLSGVSVRLRHFRNETELDLYAFDDNYDFNFQTYRTIDHVKLRKGDSLVIECINNNPYDLPIWGGDRTREEMCLSILMYYPALPTRMVCTGDVHPLDQLQAVHPEITGFSIRNNAVLGPDEYAGKTYQEVLEEADWSAELVDHFQDVILHGRYREYSKAIDFFQLKDGPNISLEPKRKVLPCTVDAPTPRDFNITSMDSGSSLATRSTAASMCLMMFIVIMVAMLMEI